METVVELFSGIGGMGCAAAGLVRVVAAFDQDREAGRVFETNLGLPPAPLNVTSLTADALRRFDAGGWLMSPPCQPFTSKGKRRDIEDPRCEGLLALITRLPEVRPRFLLLENVPPFAESRARERLVAALAGAGRHVREVTICPTQLGIPNRRLRYYLLASAAPLPAPPPLPQVGQQLADYLDREPAPELYVTREYAAEHALCMHVVASALWSAALREPQDKLPRRRFLQRLCNRERYRLCNQNATSSAIATPGGAALCPGLSRAFPSRPSPLRGSSDRKDQEAGRDPGPATTACFGSSYGRVVGRAGSYLREPDGRVRRFSPEEILRFLHFPSTFRFPPDMPLHTRYRLAGNSVNVAVVRYLVEWLVAT
jgi:site-specific DNA-cytosine methylase